MASSALNYATQLKRNDNKGPCGGAQLFDTPAEINRKFNQLFKLLSESKTVLVHTGAGVSTAAGIPDFRGPSGVWTVMSMQGNGKRRRKMTDGDCTVKNTSDLVVQYGKCKLEAVEFAQAMPSVAHLAILALLREGRIASIITQNIDGLHAISGIKHSECSEVHGNVFVERCISCGRRFLRPYVSPTISFKPTGNYCGLCSFPPCGILTDVVLDWFDRYEDHFEKRAIDYAQVADFHLTLGSSMHVEPACLYASSDEYRKEGAPLVIVNYQKTRLEPEADVVIHCDVNLICQKMLKRLKIPIPTFVRHYYMVALHYSQKGLNKLLLRLPCLVNLTVWDSENKKGTVSHRCLNVTHSVHEFSFSNDFEVSCKLFFDAEMTIHVRYLENCTMSGSIRKLSLAATNGPLNRRSREQITHKLFCTDVKDGIDVKSIKLSYNASLIPNTDVCCIVGLLDTSSEAKPGFSSLRISDNIPELMGCFTWIWGSSSGTFEKLVEVKEEEEEIMTTAGLIDQFEALPEIMRACVMDALDRQLGNINKKQFCIDVDSLTTAMKDLRSSATLWKRSAVRVLYADDHELGEMVDGAPTECRICLPRRIRPMASCRGVSKEPYGSLFMTVLQHSILDIMNNNAKSPNSLRLVNLFRQHFPQWLVTYITDLFECR